PVGPERPVNIEGRGLRMLGNASHLTRRHEMDNGHRIDETMDKTGASHADDFWPRSRHPDRSSPIVTPRDLRRSHQRLTELAPSLVATLKGLGLEALVVKPRRDGLAQGLAGLAQHDDGLPGISSAPILDRDGF